MFLLSLGLVAMMKNGLDVREGKAESTSQRKEIQAARGLYSSQEGKAGRRGESSGDIHDEHLPPSERCYVLAKREGTAIAGDATDLSPKKGLMASLTRFLVSRLAQFVAGFVGYRLATWQGRGAPETAPSSSTPGRTLAGLVSLVFNCSAVLLILPKVKYLYSTTTRGKDRAWKQETALARRIV